MTDPTPRTITRLLAAVGKGDAEARDRLWEAVYQELHHVAAGQLAREAAGIALQPSSMVNETYIRLMGDGEVAWDNRRHFFAAAARAMRRIRIDYARKRAALKRGGGQGRLELDQDPITLDGDPAELLAIDDALKRLEGMEPRTAEVVMMRYFAGLSVDETAEALGVSPRTVDNEWRFARAWLHRELS